MNKTGRGCPSPRRTPNANSSGILKISDRFHYYIGIAGKHWRFCRFQARARSTRYVGKHRGAVDDLSDVRANDDTTALSLLRINAIKRSPDWRDWRLRGSKCRLPQDYMCRFALDNWRGRCHSGFKYSRLFSANFSYLEHMLQLLLRLAEVRKRFLVMQWNCVALVG